ncbi:MAG: hypothetical protein ABJF88_14775 [Rhodothermales bacterium]
MRLLPFRLSAALLIVCLAPPASAQPEIIPAEHPVYEFLHQQRVQGKLPEYRHELRPLGRDRVGRLLDSLTARTTGTMNAVTADWLARYRREVFEPESAIETVIGAGGRIAIPTGAETEKFLYYHRDDDWRLALSAIGRVQARRSEAEATYSGVAIVPEGVLQGNYRGLVGFYTGTFNGGQVAGDTRVLQSDPVLAPLYYIGRTDIPPGNFDRATASVRAAGRVFSAEIAHARLLVGASFDDALILTEGSDYFSFVRLGVDTRVVQYQFMHGALGDRSFDVPGDEDSSVLLGPERYLAFHRLTLNPWHRLQLAFTEMVVYGQRGPELAYLNPVNPFKPAEHALWDRDNTLFALEAVLRPTDGVEAYATFLADDLDTSLLGKNSFNNKWAVQAGLGAALGPALGWVEYTRIEPFVYTHRFLLDGSFYNAYQHNGFGLGHPLGPNADQVEVGLRAWGPMRTRGVVKARYVRRGENIIDPETGETVRNVGGDITDGRQPPFTDFSKVFLAGERFEGIGLSVGLSWEPIRDVALLLFADYQQWDGTSNQLFVRSELVVDL